MALAHLAAVLPEDAPVRLLNCPSMGEFLPRHDVLTLYTASRRPSFIASFELEPWGEDDWIDYLLAADRERCASVMKRLLADGERAALGDSPELCAIVLDVLAREESITTASAALRRFLEAGLSDP